MLQYLVNDVCPECQAETISMERPPKRGLGPKREERRRYACGLYLLYDPHREQGQRISKLGLCNKSGATEEDIAKRKAATVKLSTIIASLDLDFPFRSALSNAIYTVKINND